MGLNFIIYILAANDRDYSATMTLYSESDVEDVIAGLEDRKARGELKRYLFKPENSFHQVADVLRCVDMFLVMSQYNREAVLGSVGDQETSK